MSFSVTYIESLSEEGLVTDWRKRYHHDHGKQTRKRNDLSSLKNGGNLWLGIIDLNCNKRFLRNDSIYSKYLVSMKEVSYLFE